MKHVITCRKTASHIEFRNIPTDTGFDPSDDMMFIPLYTIDIKPDSWGVEFILLDEHGNETIDIHGWPKDYIGIRYNLTKWPEKYRVRLAKAALAKIKDEFEPDFQVLVKK